MHWLLLSDSFSSPHFSTSSGRGEKMSRQSQTASRLGIGNNASQSQETNAATSSSLTATHMHACSIAILSQESLPKVESHFLERSRQQSSFSQRDLICQRLDDNDQNRILIEQDRMYQPIRKAREQNRLRIRFEQGGVDLRLYSKPSGKTIEYIDVHNLICVPLECQQESRAYPIHSLNKNGISIEIDSGANIYQQVIQAMGWEPSHNVIKKGRKFVIQQNDTCKVEALIFQLYKIESKKGQAVLERIADTWILHISATLPFRSNSSKAGESIANDASRLSERAQAEIVAIQESLKGLVRLSKEEG